MKERKEDKGGEIPSNGKRVLRMRLSQELRLHSLHRRSRPNIVPGTDFSN